jgi:phosphoglycerate dehydrogenase-like enzyme
MRFFSTVRGVIIRAHVLLVNLKLMQVKIWLNCHIGIFGEQMGGYVLGWILALERNMFTSYELQKQQVWCPSKVQCYRKMNELTVGILGAGTIGSKVALSVQV